MSKLNINKIGITILSRTNGDISLIEKKISVKGHYKDEYERREIIRNDLKNIGVIADEHLCFNCKNADPNNCPKIRDNVKQMLIDEDAYDFIEMGVQVYENKIKGLVNINDLDEAIVFNVQKCKKYKEM